MDGLFARHHPDGCARDTEKQNLATQSAQGLKASFRRSLEHLRGSD